MIMRLPSYLSMSAGQFTGKLQMFCCKSKAAIDVTDSQMLVVTAPTPRPLASKSTAPSKESKETPRKQFTTKSTASSPEESKDLKVDTPISSPVISEFLCKPVHPFTGHPNLIIIDSQFGKCEEIKSFGQKETSFQKPAKNSSDVDVVHWNPQLFFTVSKHEYGTYFPTLINQENGHLIAYNANQEKWHEDIDKPEWLGLPDLSFLPDDVNDIIAGDGGLLCVNGGVQPRSRNIHTPKIPHAEDYNLNLYPQQSILVVCNPLTQELRFIPRHTNKKLEGKLACMQILNSNPIPAIAETSNLPPRTRYRLHVLGTHHEQPTLYGTATDELILMTYDSRSDKWISGTVVGRARIPSLAKTGIALLEDGFYLGGQEETDEVLVVKEDVKKKRKCWAQEGLGCRYRARHVWANKIFFVHALTLKWHSVDFQIVGDDGLPSPEPRQAPRVLQCQAGGPVYAVTRARVSPRTIEIYEVVINNGFPTGVFDFVTRMPGDIFMNLFESETSLKEYECAAGLDYICFLAGPPNQSTIGICDLKKQEWFMSIFPPDQRGIGRYAFSKCDWTPDWKARP